MNPTTPGFWIFHGSRAVQNNQLRSIHAPVEIVYVWNRRGRELAVRLIGRQQCIHLGNFIGEWESISLDRATLHAAATAALGWIDEIYPPDIFDGSSGDEGPVRIVAIRENLRRALVP